MRVSKKAAFADEQIRVLRVPDEIFRPAAVPRVDDLPVASLDFKSQRRRLLLMHGAESVDLHATRTERLLRPDLDKLKRKGKRLGSGVGIHGAKKHPYPVSPLPEGQRSSAA